MDETTTKRIKKTYLMLSLGLIFYPIFVDDERREEKRRRKKKNKKYYYYNIFNNKKKEDEMMKISFVLF